MKSVRHIALIVLAMLLAACEALPTDRLTASMGADLLDSAEQGAAIDSLEAAVTQCSGEWNPESNMLRVSFQLERDEDLFGMGGAEDLRLFGGGTMLLGTASAEPNGNYRLRCEGPATLTAVPLRVNNEVVGLTASIKAADLLFEFPSGETTTLENAPIHGLLAPSATDTRYMLGQVLGRVYGLDPDSVSYQSLFAAQKALYENYPNSAFVNEKLKNHGLSARNAALFGELYVEQDVDRQHALLIDMLTSPEDEEYAEAVVGATVKTLVAMGLDFQTISNLFEQETDGRVSVGGFGGGAESAAAADLDVQITNRDGASSVVFTASAQEASSDGGGASSSGIIDAETGEILWSVLNGAAEGAAFVPASNAPFVSGSAVGGLDGASYTIIFRK